MKKLVFIIVLFAVISCSLDNVHVNGYMTKIKYELRMFAEDLKNFKSNMKNLEQYMKELEELRNG
jgi:hypothetical protein